MSAIPLSPGLTRRHVLGAGAIVAAAAAVGGLRLLADDVPTLAAVARADGPRLSVGYVDRDPAGGVVPLDGRPSVVPAATVRPGGLGASARAGVGALTPAALDGLPWEAVHLDALFPAPGSDEPRRFQAWSWRADPASVGAPVEFTAPVGTMSLGFGLTIVGADGEEATSVLTAGLEDGLPRLRPGTYLLGLEPSVWDEPDRLPAPQDPAWQRLASLVVTILPGR